MGVTSEPLRALVLVGGTRPATRGDTGADAMFISHHRSEPESDLPNVITMAKAGDPGAFDELYRRYAHLILRYLYLRTREPESAQDLTQEVFMRVLRNIGRLEYRGEKSFLGWLYTIAGNVLIGDVRRRRGVQTPLDESLELVDPRGQERETSAFERVFLMHAMSQLTEDQQQVLTLKFFADLTNQEIALALGRTEGAVKALQHRAIHAMQQIIERESTDPPPPAPGAELPSALRA